MVVYERFQYKALTENIFGVLELGVVAYGRWSPTGGGHSVLGSDHEKSPGVLSRSVVRTKSGRERAVTVTSQLIVESRNDRAETPGD